MGGTTDVFIGRDSLTGSNGVNASSVDLTLTNLGTTPGPSAIAYGTANNTNAIAVGAATSSPNAGGPGQVWFSTTNTAGSLTQLTNYAETRPTRSWSIRSQSSRLFVADTINLVFSPRTPMAPRPLAV